MPVRVANGWSTSFVIVVTTFSMFATPIVIGLIHGLQQWEDKQQNCINCHRPDFAPSALVNTLRAYEHASIHPFFSSVVDHAGLVGNESDYCKQLPLNPNNLHGEALRDWLEFDATLLSEQDEEADVEPAAASLAFGVFGVPVLGQCIRYTLAAAYCAHIARAGIERERRAVQARSAERWELRAAPFRRIRCTYLAGVALGGQTRNEITSNVKKHPSSETKL